MKFKPKAVIFDLDGTITNLDILDLICSLANNQEQSKEINKNYVNGVQSGLTPLIRRINLLKGLRLSQIYQLLDTNPHLTPGIFKLFEILKKHSIITIINSGNILPVINYYKKMLNADFSLGSDPIINHGIIQGIDKSRFLSTNFKFTNAEDLLKKLSIKWGEVIAFGDSISDACIFEKSKISIAINPKGDIANYSTHMIINSFENAIPIINQHLD